MAKNDFWQDVNQALANGAMFYLGYSIGESLIASEHKEAAEILEEIFEAYSDKDELSDNDVADIKNKLLQYEYGVNDGVIEQLFESWKKN